MVFINRFLMLLIVSILPCIAFGQNDYGISFSNVTHKTDKGSVIISFDVSFSKNMMGTTVTLGVKAYINPYKQQNIDDIMRICTCLNNGFADVFSGKNLRVQHGTYRNVVLSVPRSAIRNAIEGYGKFRISFVPCAVVDNEIETYWYSRPISYTYTFNPPSNSNHFSRKTAFKHETENNYNALVFYPDGLCESNGYILLEDGWPMHGSAKGTYYIQGRNIHIIWEGEVKEVLYEQRNDQNLYQNGKIEYLLIRE